MKNRSLLLGLVVLFLTCFGLNSINAQSNDQWISLGPDNVGGRTRAIIFDRFNDNVMYSGGVAGGLFISVNSGKNWHEIIIANGESNLSITTIAQDNDGVIYLGTGEGHYKNAGFGISNARIGMLGNGVYKSTTLNASNKTWAANLGSDQEKYAWVDANMQFEILDFTKPASAHNYGDGKSFVNKIAVNKTNNKVYVATDAGLMVMNDDISGWSPISVIPQTASVGDIILNNNGVIATYFNDGEGKVMISADDFATNSVIFNTAKLAVIDPTALTINRIKLAFGTKHPNKLYAYANYINENENVRQIREVLVRTDDINNIEWKRTTPISYSNGYGVSTLAIGVDDRGEREYVYLGGDVVRRGYNANNSDVYYWERISKYYNEPDNNDAIRTSPSYVSSGINEIIFKENPKTIEDSVFIAVATNAGIHIYSYDSVLHQTAWRVSAKGMVTTQFYSVAVSPDASIVGGTEANGSIYIPSSSNGLGVNKSGDVIWTINSEGYNPNSFQFTTSGGNVGASQFQREEPTPRKSLILSRPFAQIARTYGNNGDYQIIDDVTWNYGKTLFYTNINENSAWAPNEPAVTPMLLWESIDSQLPDSMLLVINKNTAINGKYDPDWKEGAWIKPNDTVTAKSPNMEYPFYHVFTDSLQYNQDTAILIQNPIQSRLFFGTSQGIYVCSNINDYMASPLEGSLTKISFVKIYDTKKFANVPTEEIHCFAITGDGKTLFVSTDKVGAVTDTSFLYRFDLSKRNFLTTNDTINPEIQLFTRKITSINVDKKNGNNVLLTFGTYISANSNIQVSSNALASPFTSATFKEVVNIDPENGTDFLPNSKPVFCGLIESVKSTTGNVAYIGAEDGIYRTDNFLGTPNGVKQQVEWYKMSGIPNVPVFQLTQQTMNLPRREHFNYVGQNAFQTTFLRTELPGAIYAATYGKGLFAFLGDTIAPREDVIRIEENITLSKEGATLRVYPNPAYGTTTLDYNLTETSSVMLQVYDMNGRLVSSLDKGRQSEGNHRVQMNVENMKKGVYVIRVITNNSTNTAKLIVR